MLFPEKSTSALVAHQVLYLPCNETGKIQDFFIFVKTQSMGPLMALSNEIIFKSSCCKAIVVLLEFAMKNNFCLKKSEESNATRYFICNCPNECARYHANFFEEYMCIIKSVLKLNASKTTDSLDHCDSLDQCYTPVLQSRNDEKTAITSHPQT